MPESRDEVLDAALKLSQADRLVIVSRLMDTLDDDLPGPGVDDPGLLEELERRTVDPSPTIPASELWQDDR